ncbi:AraC family transcriptional regulator [Bacillus sp. ISL-46]|uniref:AraC family transcriptional regulator n=1 Tax=Bacillus sp. ISL-46 TaxID=2819129 RepID=UPI001BE8E9E8|nr:AraC family transcriptional regulator [Bacillus sp. ISL-46]MBT2721145.1 helix-turn-helix transcriptional regulator [Bacillus sp. ISL-46]
MKYPYESVVINKEIPMFLLMNSVKYVAMHWHDRIEILFVLRGQIHVYVGREEYFLHESDLLLINSNEVHGVESSEDNKLLVLQIPISFINKWYKDIEKETFICQSFQHEEQASFNIIRSLMAQLMIILRTQGKGFEIKIQSLLLDIIYNLITKFRVKNNEQINRNSRKDIERLTRITSYIQQNFMHPLTLNEIAENEQLTVPYLSRYFQEHMGQTFVKYLNGIRLEHAVRSMLDTELSIIQIAMESGFSNLNTFHKLFKETFHTTPNQYRKKHSYHSSHIRHKQSGIKGYEYSEQDSLNELYKYLIFSEKDKN